MQDDVWGKDAAVMRQTNVERIAQLTLSALYGTHIGPMHAGAVGHLRNVSQFLVTVTNETRPECQRRQPSTRFCTGIAGRLPHCFE